MVDRGVFSDIFNPLSFVDAAVRSFAATKGPVDMGPGFVPGVGSVICGRGELCNVFLLSIGRAAFGSLGASMRSRVERIDRPVAAAAPVQVSCEAALLTTIKGHSSYHTFVCFDRCCTATGKECYNHGTLRSRGHASE